MSGDSRAMRRWGLLAAACTMLGSVVTVLWGVPGSGACVDRFRRWPPLDVWMRFDACWYAKIAESGYWYSPGEKSPVVYFPLYPMLMRLGSRLSGMDVLLVGVILSAAAGLAAIVVFRRWGERLVGAPHADRSLWVLLLWPCAYYLVGAVYSDAVFLFLAIAAFLALEHRRPWLAGVLGALVTAARPIAPALLFGFVARQQELRWREQRPLGLQDLAPALALLGLGSYMAFLSWRFGDPAAFVHAQAGWFQTPGPRTWLKLDLWQSGGWLHPIQLLNLALGLLMLGLTPTVGRRLGWGYAAYCFAVIAMPLVSAKNFIGLARYAMAAFPCWLALSLWLEERPRWRYAWLATSGVLLALFMSKYAMGRYVS